MANKVLGVDDGSLEASVGIEKRDRVYVPRKQFSLTYLVLAQDTNQTEDEILATSGIPALWSFLRGAYCKRLVPKEVSTVIHPVTGIKAALWEVEAQYDSDVDPEQNQEPTAKQPTIRWYGEIDEEVLEYDVVTGEPVQTDAEEPIIITTPVVHPILEIRRYENHPFDPNIMLDYANHTNASVFWGAPRGCALMLPMEVDEDIIEGTKYCVVTYKIKFKIRKEGGEMVQDTWKAKVLHHGYKYVSSLGPPKVIETFEDAKGNPATTNLRLGTGEALNPGDPPEYKQFNRFCYANLNALSL